MKKVLPNLMRREIGARGARRELESWGEKQTISLLGVHLTLVFDSGIQSIAFDSDGRRIACAHDDGTLRILDPRTGECSKLLHGQRLEAMVVTFNPNPDEEFELAGGIRNSDNGVRLWDKEGSCHKSRALGASVCSVSFDAQGGVLAVAADRLFALDTKKNRFHLLHGRELKAVIFHPCLSPFLITAMALWEDFSGRPVPRMRIDGVPPLVLLNIWDLVTSKEDKKCRLTISHVVLYSEKCVAISPSGRLLAVCVARRHPDCVGDDDTSHSSGRRLRCISREDVVYELRIYSLIEPTFGDVIASQNCEMLCNLTSIKFSPTSEHLLLAFGGNISFGGCSDGLDRILEVRTVPELELVWHLDDAMDSTNVALFHPLVGHGLVYCTRMRRFHILMADFSRPPDPTHD